MRDARLHHVGFVVRSIEESMGGFLSSMDASWNSQVYHDPIQKVSVAFLTPGSAEDAQVELVEPAGEDSPVQRFLQKAGGGLHHLCYEVADLNAHLTAMRARGCRLAKPAAPAVAFGGRRIAWMLTPQNLLLEFLEQER